MKSTLFLIVLVFFSFASVQAQDLEKTEGQATLPGSKKHTGRPWYGFYPYLPFKREYSLELGNMWEEQTLYWVAGRVGFHTGKCLAITKERCQQYWDLLGGVGGRDGFTNGFVLTGPRWQFIRYPKFYSPSLSLVVGAMNISDQDRDEQHFAYGIGYGWTAAVHENLDLKIEGRLGYGDQVWSHFYVGLGLKLDNLVQYFGNKIKGIGEGTLEFTGKVIKETGDVIDKVIPLKNDDPKNNSEVE